MKSIIRFPLLPAFLVAAYLLSACGESLPKSAAPVRGPKVKANVVAFTGIVEAIHGTEWTVSGQRITLDPQASLDPNIAVGDEVKVKAQVSAGEGVVAMKVESTKSDAQDDSFGNRNGYFSDDSSGGD